MEEARDKESMLRFLLIKEYIWDSAASLFAIKTLMSELANVIAPRHMQQIKSPVPPLTF